MGGKDGANLVFPLMEVICRRTGTVVVDDDVNPDDGNLTGTNASAVGQRPANVTKTTRILVAIMMIVVDELVIGM